jgi:hypothetical protein
MLNQALPLNLPHGSFVMEFKPDGSIVGIPHVATAITDPTDGAGIVVPTLRGPRLIDAYRLRQDADLGEESVCSLVIPHNPGPPPNSPNAAWYDGSTIFDGKRFRAPPVGRSAANAWWFDCIDLNRTKRGLLPLDEAPSDE